MNDYVCFHSVRLYFAHWPVWHKQLQDIILMRHIKQLKSLMRLRYYWAHYPLKKVFNKLSGRTKSNCKPSSAFLECVPLYIYINNIVCEKWVCIKYNTVLIVYFISNVLVKLLKVSCHFKFGNDESPYYNYCSVENHSGPNSFNALRSQVLCGKHRNLFWKKLIYDI